jgi:hypothetical protein
MDIQVFPSWSPVLAQLCLVLIPSNTFSDVFALVGRLIEGVMDFFYLITSIASRSPLILRPPMQA